MKPQADFTRFAAAIRRTNQKVSKADVPSSLDLLAQKILRTAARGAPVLTGALRASGRVKRTNQYQRIVQFGGSGTGVDYATFVEFGTFRQRPKPFLRPAVMAAKKDMAKIFRVKMGMSFERLAQQFPPKGRN